MRSGVRTNPTGKVGAPARLPRRVPKTPAVAASRRSNVDYPAADECVLGLKALADIAAADKWRLQRHDLSRGSTRDTRRQRTGFGW